MKKLIAICFATFLFGTATHAQTTAPVKTPQKISTKHRVIKKLNTPAAQAVIQQAKAKKAQQAVRREGQ